MSGEFSVRVRKSSPIPLFARSLIPLPSQPKSGYYAPLYSHLFCFGGNPTNTRHYLNDKALRFEHATCPPDYFRILITLTRTLPLLFCGPPPPSRSLGAKRSRPGLSMMNLLIKGSNRPPSRA